MKTLIAVFAAMLVASFFGVATMAKAAEKTTTMEKPKTVEGYIVDTKCTTGKEAKQMEKAGKFDQFTLSHSKECLLKCGLGGCKFYSDGRLWKLDKESNKAIEAYLKTPDSTPHIKAELVPAKGDEVTLQNIEAVK